MFELFFLLTAGQCVPGHATTHEALINNTTPVLVGETITLDTIDDIAVAHNQNLRNSNCAQETPYLLPYNFGDDVPVVHGNHQRLIDSVIEEYSAPDTTILFVELGTTDASSRSYDLQDYIFVVKDTTYKTILAD